jgi:two-component system, cell cycle sensor histidine kinase and response regulator CckA
MQSSLQKQLHINILPALSVNEKLRLREVDINEVVKTVQGVLPQHFEWDNNVIITLVAKNLTIMANMALMKEALTHHVRNLMDVMPGYGKFSLTLNQVNYDIESLLNSGDPIIGACAFIPLTIVRSYISVHELINEKILKPFFTTKIDVNGLRLISAYRIVKEHHDSIKGMSRLEQSEEVNMYLPLSKMEMVNMMSIPAG